MKWEDILEQLAEAFKIPETFEEVKAFIKNDPGCQVTIEEMAFKQVVINILVAAGIVSENDFNESVKHFKEVLTNEFAKRMLETIKREGLSDHKPKIKEVIIDEDEEDYDDWDNDDAVAGKA